MPIARRINLKKMKEKEVEGKLLLVAPTRSTIVLDSESLVTVTHLPSEGYRPICRLVCEQRSTYFQRLFFYDIILQFWSLRI
jgi:hypothetical protein